MAASTFALASPASAEPESFAGPVTGNLALKGEPNPFSGVSIAGSFDADASTISARATFPASVIVQEDALPGNDAEVAVQISQPNVATGTFDSETGALTLDAAFQLEITEVNLVNQETGARSPIPIGDGTCIFGPIEVDLVGDATGDPLSATVSDAEFVIPEPANPATDCGPVGSLIIPNVAGPNEGEDPNSAELSFGLSPLGMQVDAIYQAVLDRDADPAGRDYWISKLNSGTSEMQVAMSIARTREGWSNSVNDTYQLALGREADNSGLTYWTDALLRDQQPLFLAGQLFASSEAYGYAMDMDPEATDGEAFVTYLYGRVLDRAPDSSGYAYWSGKIDAAPNGAIARMEVVRAVMSMNEHVNTAARHADSAACGAEATDAERLATLADVYRKSDYNQRVTRAVAAATAPCDGSVMGPQ